MLAEGCRRAVKRRDMERKGRYLRLQRTSPLLCAGTLSAARVAAQPAEIS